MCGKFLAERCFSIFEMYCYGTAANFHDVGDLILLFPLDECVANYRLMPIRQHRKNVKKQLWKLRTLEHITDSILTVAYNINVRGEVFRQGGVFQTDELVKFERLNCFSWYIDPLPGYIFGVGEDEAERFSYHYVYALPFGFWENTDITNIITIITHFFVIAIAITEILLKGFFESVLILRRFGKIS